MIITRRKLVLILSSGLQRCLAQSNKQHDVYEWKQMHSSLYGDNLYGYVNTKTHEIVAKLSKYDQEPWFVFIRGTSYGEFETLEAAKKRVEDIVKTGVF